jgi:hypothetical protein
MIARAIHRSRSQAGLSPGATAEARPIMPAPGVALALLGAALVAAQEAPPAEEEAPEIPPPVVFYLGDDAYEDAQGGALSFAEVVALAEVSERGQLAVREYERAGRRRVTLLGLGGVTAAAGLAGVAQGAVLVARCQGGALEDCDRGALPFVLVMGTASAASFNTARYLRQEGIPERHDAILRAVNGVPEPEEAPPEPADDKAGTPVDEVPAGEVGDAPVNETSPDDGAPLSP